MADVKAPDAGEPPAAPPPPPRRRWGRWLLAAVIVGAIAIYFLAFRQYDFEYVRDHLAGFQERVNENLLVSLLIFFVIYVTATGLSLPIATPLSLLGGALFGRWLGTALIDVGATIGATLAFLSSRYLFQDAVQRRVGERLEALNRGLEKDGAFYLFTLRLVPFFPFFLINLGMGLTRMRVWTYFWVSLVGMLPGTFVYVNAGNALSTIKSPKDVMSPEVLVSFILLGIAPLVFRKLLQWFRRS
jgi:uncharacterized membrane protein YdjX (TVP38/TMEM64 family)